MRHLYQIFLATSILAGCISASPFANQNQKCVAGFRSPCSNGQTCCSPYQCDPNKKKCLKPKGSSCGGDNDCCASTCSRTGYCSTSGDSGVGSQNCITKPSLCNQNQFCEGGVCKTKTCTNYPSLCSNSQYCDGGACKPRTCASTPPLDCGILAYCDTTSNKCQPKNCLTTDRIFRCRADQYCKNNVCTARTCDSNPPLSCTSAQYCPAGGTACQQQTCKTVPGITCDQDKYCDNDGVCKQRTCDTNPPLTCTSGQYCPSGGTACLQQTCKTTPGITCDLEKYCDNDGTCKPRTCDSNPPLACDSATQSCPAGGTACVAKTCKTTPGIACSNTQYCADDGTCQQRTCTSTPPRNCGFYGTCRESAPSGCCQKTIVFSTCNTIADCCDDPGSVPGLACGANTAGSSPGACCIQDTYPSGGNIARCCHGVTDNNGNCCGGPGHTCPN